MRMAVGRPVSTEPVLIANQRKDHLMGPRKKMVQPTAMRSAQRAVKPDAELAKAAAKASSIHPTTSLRIPLARTISPTSVAKSLVSVRMRQRTGKAVIEMATPMNKKK